MLPRCGPDEELTGEFRVCIDAQRERFASFRVWLASFPVEDVIGAEMDEDGVQVICDPDQVQNGQHVYRISKLRLDFAIVDPMVSGCVEDYIGPQIHESRSGLWMVGYIKISSGKSVHLMRAQCGLKVLSELSAGAKESNLHAISAMIIRDAYSKTTLCSEVISMRFPHRGLLHRRTSSTRTM